MLVYSILPILLWLSVHDLKFHRIPNTSLLALSLVGLIHSLLHEPSWRAQFSLTAIIFLLSLISYLLLGLGMGDIKLLIILALLVIPADIERLQIFLNVFSISALIHMLIAVKCKFRREIAIPLAPAISFATLIALLG
jgi:Flp pilus assembly protein protease CpaA